MNGLAIPWRRVQRDITGATATSWLPQWSVPAAMRAVRATVVVSSLFAITLEGIGNLQMATFAAFGSFATLVLASFAGTRRDKLVAHLGLAIAGSVLLTIGTAVTSSTALAAIVTVPVTFAVFYAGVAGPNAAAGVTGALLAYVLPAASAGTFSMVPDRLAGWWLASVVGTAAVMALSPKPAGDRLRAATSRLARQLADEIDAALRGAASEDGLEACIAAKHELLGQFTATPFRPTGLAAPDQAIADAVELLEWCTSLLADTVHEHGDLRDAWPADRELFGATVAVLRDTATLFDGGDARPDIDRLERCRTESLQQLGERMSDTAESREAVQLSFHAHAIAIAVRAGGADALVASRLADPEEVAEQRRRWYGGSMSDSRAPHRVSSVAAAAIRDANLRSVWFINSVRGAVALAAAVAIADLSSVQHGFWVVLGTLSVLRTNAASTGSTALRALAGTVIGFVIGGALLLAIGSGSGALWAVLPVAVFVAAYAPGTAPFAVGQAAFTVTVAVLFNLLVPVGWQVGVVRIEDVAIGCAVSLVAGALFWPRGVAAVVGDDLADAFRAGASYLTQAVEWACGSRPARPDGAMAAINAALRLDDALRAFLAEQGTKHVAKQELWRLVGGSIRLRLTAHEIAALPGDATNSAKEQDVVRRRTGVLASWYDDLADLVGKPRRRTVTTLEAPTLAEAGVVEAASGSHYGVWLCEHLDHLCEHLSDLIRPADRIAEIRRRPWWR